MIKALDEATITRLCSSQVVISLASAVKELVENSLDAEATSISVKFFDLGANSVEVSDNGCGIERENLELLAHKHATSKLKSFDDLEKLVSFGFRGEALSSLAHLSKLVVTTRHKDSENGYKAEYDSDGSISVIEPIARPVGTTVLMNELFYSFPVRRKLLTDLKSCNKEFNSAVEFILPYCLISLKAKISIYKVVKNSLKLIHTNANNTGLSYQKNLQNIYGSKILNDLLYFSSEIVPLDIDLSIEGYISKPIIEQSEISLYGRSSADRQFVFINNRPCNFKVFIKSITDLWRRVGQESLDHSSSGIKMPLRSCFSANKHPMIFLVIKCQPDMVDVNLTPDKRTLFIRNEKQICLHIQTVLRICLENYTQCKSKSVQETAHVEQSKIVDQSFGFTKLTPDLNDISMTSQPKIGVASRTFEMMKPLKRDSQCLKEAKEINKEHEETSAKRSKVAPINNSKDSHINQNGIAQVSDVKVIDYSGNSCNSFLPRQQPFGNKYHTGKFHASNLNRDQKDLRKVEDELERLIKSEDFLKMSVIGQFNKGFIITELNNDDLFIIDQHASDEKFRFESLMKNYKPKPQPLACEQNLGLTMEQEDLLIDNLKIFEESGFQFTINEGEKIRLKAVPTCDNKIFNKSDVEEMLCVIKETGTSYCRPTKLRDKLASMACRSAIMIGDDLNNQQMSKILKKLSELVHPWNCPHGRPTMRHLFHLNRIQV